MKQNFFRTSGLMLAVFLAAFTGHAQIVVVDAGATNVFSVSATPTNFVWQLDGVTVGGNSNSFAYKPQVNDVGIHYLTVDQILAGGIKTNSYRGVRVRITLPATGANYYVATNGSDSNPGTLASPFRTPDKARDVVRALARPLPAGGVTVWLRGGNYYRTSSLGFTNASDSGTVAAPIVFRSYPNETAIISGGKAINASAFVPLNSTQTNRVAPGVNPTNILELDLATAGIVNKAAFPSRFNEWVTYNPFNTGGDGGLCELFYNGQRMYLSRYPNHNLTNDNLNTSYMYMDGVATTDPTDPSNTNYLNSSGIYTNSAGVPVSVGGAFHYSNADASHVARWTNAFANGGAWMQGYWRVAWQMNGVKILGVDVTNQVILIDPSVSVSGGIGDKYTRPEGSHAEKIWALNLLEEVDQPGEWCVDFNRNKLYFYAPAPLTNNEVEVSDLTAPLVTISGASNVVFQSVTFQEGLTHGVYATNGVRNLVLGCTLRNMGNFPVYYANGFTNGVVGCDMYDLAGGGVYFVGGNETSSPRVPARHFAVNNYVHDYMRVTRISQGAFDVGFGGAYATGGHKQSVGMRVANNKTRFSPHLANCHGSWDNLYEYNDVANFCEVGDDVGAFYSADSFANEGNATFRYNFFHDSYQGDGIYFDGDHRDMHIYGNIINLRTSPTAGHGIGYIYKTGSQATSGNEQTIECYNNLAVSCGYDFQFYVLLPSKVQENAAIKWNKSDYSWTQVVVGTSSNTFASSSAAVLASGTNMSYTGDPGFLDLTNNDMRLKPDAQLYTDLPNFKQIPFELAGIYNDEFRTNAPGLRPYVLSANASNVTTNGATFNGRLYFPQFESNSLVKLYWGSGDGGTNFGAWANVTSLGVNAAGALSTNLTGLDVNTAGRYYYRYYATNAFGQSWSPATFSFGTNIPPVLNVLSNVTIPSGSTYYVTAIATDADFGQTITFSLDTAPLGATIDPASGALTWLSGAAGGYPVTVRVTDNGTPAPASSTRSFTITVSSSTGGLANRTSGGTATASNQNPPNETSDKAFDGLTSTKWYTSGTYTSGWLQYRFTNGVGWAVTQYNIASANDVPARDPKNWQLLGSFDGANWTLLDAQSNQVFAARQTFNSPYNFSNAVAYPYYRLNILTNNGPNGIQLSELQFYAPQDITPPIITVPADIVTNAASASGATVNFTTSAVDAMSGVRPTTNSPASGSLFAVGTNLVTVTAGDASGNVAGKTFNVIVTPPALIPVFTGINLAGANLIVTGTNGTAGANYIVLTATNLVLPPANWTAVSTQQFDAGGSFIFTNAINPTNAQNYYLLKTP